MRGIDRQTKEQTGFEGCVAQPVLVVPEAPAPMIATLKARPEASAAAAAAAVAASMAFGSPSPCDVSPRHPFEASDTSASKMSSRSSATPDGIVPRPCMHMARRGT